MTDFITDNMMHDALEYMSLTPHPSALAKGRLVDAENQKKIVRDAQFMASVFETIAERQADAGASVPFREACDKEAAASRELEEARARLNWANAVVECWRTQAANIRSLDKMR